MLGSKPPELPELLPSLLAHCEITTYAPWPGFDMYFYFPAVFTYQEQVTGKVV